MINLISKAWGCTATKLPKKYQYDYLIQKGVTDHTKPAECAVAEVKCRRIEMRKYPTYAVSHLKFKALQEEARTGMPAFLIVQWTDCTGYLKITPDMTYLRSIGGRKDRSDPDDIEIMVHIPVDDFELFRGKKKATLR